MTVLHFKSNKDERITVGWPFEARNPTIGHLQIHNKNESKTIIAQRHGDTAKEQKQLSADERK